MKYPEKQYEEKATAIFTSLEKVIPYLEAQKNVTL